MITVRLKNVQADDQDHSNPLLGNKKTLFVVIDINCRKMKDSEGLENCTFCFQSICSVVGQTCATTILIERDPLTLTVVMKRAIVDT